MLNIEYKRIQQKYVKCTTSAMAVSFLHPRRSRRKFPFLVLLHKTKKDQEDTGGKKERERSREVGQERRK